MKRLTRTLPVILAAALQLLPLLRTLVTSPATTSTFAIILRWGIGAGAAFGAVDAVSGATSAFTTPSTFSGAVGTAFNNNVTVSIGGGNTAASNDYFILSAGTVTSALLMNGQNTTATLPPGLTFTASWANGASTIGGVISGTPTTAGSYATTVTCVSPGNASLSQNITITISGTTTPTAPAITTQPAAANVVAGKNATFTAAASGTAPVGFYWLKNGSPLANGGNISGATTATLTVATVSATDAGNYSVLASNAVGTATSTAAALTVLLPPTVTSPPAAQTQAVGSTATFSVTAGGSTPLSYFWLKNGTNLANGTKYSGVNASTLTVASVATADAGNYSVTITNLAGSITSSSAALSVVALPTITTSPANLTVIAGASATFTVTAAGSAPLVYHWLKNGAPLADGGNVSGAATATLNLATVTSGDAASYSVTVTNSLGSVTSSAATLTVILPPALTSQPAAQTQAVGGTATFSVTADGSAPLNYFWLKNGAAIANGTKYSGVNSSTLTVATVATADAGNYSVIITNLAGSVTSSVAPLSVVSSPTFVTQPANQTIIIGGSATFAVTAAGSAPLVYQWLKNGAVISGANANVLTLAAVTTNDAANYSVTVTNSLGSITSAAATLTVAIPPAIVTPPANVTIIAGSNVSFTVTASGSAPLNYQWLKNGIKISGATSATLTLANVSAADAANYSVTVTNAVGTATSGNATLTVLVPPAIASHPANATVVQGSAAAFTVTATGTAPLNFQWLKNGVAIPGANSNVLALAAVTTNDAANYSVVVTNIVGNIASSSATLTVLVPPAIVTQPADATVVAGNGASFTVTASGTAPLNFQWRKNGVNLSGATAATLTLASVTTNDAANYSVTVGNAAGSATSGNAVLTVQSPPAIVTQPLNQNTAIGNSLTLTVAVSGTGPLSYQWFTSNGAVVDGGNISGAATSTLSITALTTNEVGIYYVVVSNFLGTATSANASVSVNVAPVITVPPVGQTVAVSNTAMFTVTATGTGPLAYRWLKNGIILTNGTIIYSGTPTSVPPINPPKIPPTGSSTGSSTGPSTGPSTGLPTGLPKNPSVTGATIAGATLPTLVIANVSTNDNGSYSVIITNIYGSITSSIAALAVFTPPAISVQPTNHTAIIGTNITLAVSSTGSGPLRFQWFKNGSALVDGGNISGSTTNILKISALTTADAGNYFVTVGNAVGSATSGSAALTILVPPSITAQPASQSVIVSNTVTFSVAATGTAPLRYQWRKGTAAIAGATNFIFTLASAKTTDAAVYSVVVTNLAGSVTSSNATLTVNVAPVFTVQATNRFAKLGTNTIFRAAVSGTAPFSYQWFKNGSPLTNSGNIAGSFSNVLTVSALTTNDAGAYSLTVSNLAGTATSSNAVLTLLLPPTIVTQPASQSVVVSNAVSFSVSATGTATLRYQWRKGATAIAGATNFTFSLASVKTNDAANYSVVITNFAGSVTSAVATLTVWVPPVFTAQAASRTATNGTTTVFSATVKGTAPFSYQWFKNGKALADGGNISGSLSNVLTVASLTSADAGDYTLTVSNFGGSITSSNATLKVVKRRSSGSGENAINNNVAIQSKAAVASIPVAPPAIAKLTKKADGGITLNCSGAAGTNYVLQASANLADWTNLSTNTVPTGGQMQVNDPDAAKLPCRFYRLIPQ